MPKWITSIDMCKWCVFALAGILSDPDKRRRYDQGGFANLNPSALEVQLDLSSLGMVNTAMAAIFNKLGESEFRQNSTCINRPQTTPFLKYSLGDQALALHCYKPEQCPANDCSAIHAGVPVKTVVAQHVLDAAYMGNFKALQLQFGEKHSDKVHSASAMYPVLWQGQLHCYCLPHCSVLGALLQMPCCIISCRQMPS